MGETVPSTSLSAPLQELMLKVPLKEIQSTRTQRPTASSSCPYVEMVLGDVTAQHTMQLQLEQVGPAPAPRPRQPAPHSHRTQQAPLWSGQDRSGPGRAPGSIRPTMGAGTNPMLHRTVVIRVVSQRKVFGGIMGEPQVVCRILRSLMGNRRNSEDREVLKFLEC